MMKLPVNLQLCVTEMPCIAPGIFNSEDIGIGAEPQEAPLQSGGFHKDIS